MEHDKSNALRFLGYCVRHKDQPPDLQVFASPQVGAFCEAYLTMLRETLKLAASSLANYTNSILAVSQFAMTVYDTQDTPVDQLVNLRRQCEAVAKQDALYKHKDPNWIDWPTAQQARISAVAAYEAHKSLSNLKTAVHISFHTLQPPDRKLLCNSLLVMLFLTHVCLSCVWAVFV